MRYSFHFILAYTLEISVGSARAFGVVSWVKPLLSAFEMRRPEQHRGDEISLHAVRRVVRVLVGLELDGTWCFQDIAEKRAYVKQKKINVVSSMSF